MRVLGYIRCSTTEQAESSLGLLAQRALIESESSRRGWTLLEVVEDAGFSAGSLNRPGITRVRQMLSAGEAEAVIVAKLDRISRSVFDAAGLLETARKEHWSIIALDLPIEIGTPNGEMIASVLVAMGQFERRLASVRTKDALAQAKARGTHLGRPFTLSPEIRVRIADLRAEGLSLRSIASVLTQEGLNTARGGPWQVSTIQAVLGQMRGSHG